jgi:hypothetical protein
MPFSGELSILLTSQRKLSALYMTFFYVLCVKRMNICAEE